MPSETPKLDELLTDSPHFTKVSREMFAVARAELAALREKVSDLESSLKWSCEHDWTGSICDRLNSMVRENADLFIECRDGPSASILVSGIHGAFNNLRRQVKNLESQLTHLVSDAGPDSCAEQLAKARNAALEEAAMLHEQIPNHCSHEINCPGCGAIGAIVRYRDAIRALKGS